MKYKSWLFTLSMLLSPSVALAAVEDDVTFKIPSSLSLGASSSNTNSTATNAALRWMLPKNYWLDFAFDRATDETDGLKTTTQGGSFSVGTDPIEDAAVEIGIDGFGIADQFHVRELRVRGVWSPESFFGSLNPGIEFVVELRGALFKFSNSPNPIFRSNEVELEAKTLRAEFGWFGWAPWTVRVWSEQTQLAQDFVQLERPLAPIFVPLTAISTAVSWPGEEYGASLGYGRNRWSARILGAWKKASISHDESTTFAISGDYRWTRRFSTGLRVSTIHVISDASTDTLEPAQVGGLDLVLSF